VLKLFVVVSGLPGSGKTTLGRRLAPALNLPLIDKDDILNRLFESKGVGDASWRRALSRESDLILEQQALNSDGAVLVSFWRLSGMPPDSGTPTAWLRSASHHLVNVHCVCEPAIAASRFVQRQRHPGHLDGESTNAEILLNLRALTGLAPLDLGKRIEVDTSQELDLAGIVRAIRDAPPPGPVP
jgi:glucokinase